MTTCTCRKGAIDPKCERHVWPTYYLTEPRSRSLWERFKRWVAR